MIQIYRGDKMAKLPMNYDNYVFDLYGTLVDIRTDENLDFVWRNLRYSTDTTRHCTHLMS